ncbi:phage tail tape measure protein [Priestia megaterium]
MAMSDGEVGKLKVNLQLDSSDFSKNIQTVNRRMKMLESDFKAAQVGVDKYDNSIENLSKTSDHLTQKFQLQQVKVNEMKRRYEELARTKGVEAKETENMLIRYNKTVAEMRKTELALQSVNTKITEQGSAFNRTSKEVDKALSTISQDLKVAESEFKSTTAGMAKMGEESEHLYAQSQHLQRVFDLQEQAVKQLKLRYEQTAKAKGEDARETKEALIKYNEAISAMRKTGNSLNDLNHKIDDQVGKWKIFGRTVDNGSERLGAAAQKMKDIGGGLTAGLTTTVAATGIGLGKLASDVESATARLSIQLGATDKQAKVLGETAKGVWKDGFGEDMAEASRGVQQVKQNIKNLSDGELKKVTKDSLLLADVWEADVNEVTRAGGNIMEGFGIKSKKAYDLMAYGAQNGLNFSNEMFDNLSEYAPLFGKMGFSADEYFQLLINGSKAGVYNLDYINDAMKEFQIRAKDGSKSTAGAMGQLSEKTQKLWHDYENGKATVKDVHNAVIKELKGMDNQTNANNIGVALYGTKWEDLESKAMYSLGGIDGKLKGVNGTMDNAAKKYEETFSVRAKKALRDTLDAVIPLGNSLLNVAERVLPKVESTVSTVASTFEKMPPSAQNTVLALGGIAAIAGPLLIGLGGLVSMGAPLIGMLGGAGAGAGILAGGLAALTGPVGLTVAGVAALTAGGIALYKNWDTVNAVLDKNPFAKQLVYMNPVTGSLMGIVGGVQKVKSMYDEVIPKADLFGDSVSKGTQKAVEAYMKMDEGATTSLMTMYAKQQTITDQNMATMMGKYDNMTNQILSKLDSRYSQELSKAQKLFADSSALSSSEEAKILQNMETWHENKRASVQAYEDKIKGIYQKAKEEHRSINESEYLTIKGIQEQMRKTAVETLSKSEAEQKIILGHLETESGNITARQAAKVIQNSYKQKTESVKHANAQYKETVHNIEYMRDVTGQLSEKQAKKMIEEAKHARDKSVAHAESMHQKVVEEAKSQAKGHGKWIDSETGEVADGWDKMWSKVSSTWDKIKSIFGVKSSSKTVHKKGDNTGGYEINAGGRATGTPNGGHPGGWAVTSEQGRELIHEPGKGTYLSGSNGPELRYLQPGSSVLPNPRTEQFLKKYGFEGKIPGYEDGVGDYFDTIMKGPGAVWDAVTKKVGGFTDSLLPSWFIKGTGSITSRIKELAQGKIKSLIDEWGFGDGGPAPNIKGGASAWRGQILKAAAAMKESITPAQVNGIIAQIQRESGGNQKIVQSSAVRDINTRNGNPARGLLQYIPQTFNAYKVKGHGNIYSGYDQLLAFFNNTSWRKNLPYGKRGWGPTGGRKYEKGGIATHPQFASLAENGFPEWIISSEPKYRERSKALWTQAGETLGMFSEGKAPNMPGSSSTTNNYKSSPSISIDKIEVNYSGDASEQDLIAMAQLFKQQLMTQIKQELIGEIASYKGRMGIKFES